ncbi:MAG: phenylalanine--tRNA ligase beta subunit-related protein, partial [Thermovirgaceae bacterium]
MISVSAKWKEAYPDASFGVLVIEGVQNGKWNRQLDTKRELLEERIRTQYSGKSKKEIRAEPLFAEYQRYFRKFGQNYPVLLQLETVALKGRPIRSPSPLVASMFMAELESGLLTAGHDFDSLETPLHLAIAEGEERYVTMDGTERILKKGDMFFSDQKGVLSSVLYGPDNRSMITKDTSRVLFTVYGHPL